MTAGGSRVNVGAAPSKGVTSPAKLRETSRLVERWRERGREGDGEGEGQGQGEGEVMLIGFDAP